MKEESLEVKLGRANGEESAYPSYMPSRPDNETGFTKREVIVKDVYVEMLGACLASKQSLTESVLEKVAFASLRATDALLVALATNPKDQA